MRIQLVDRLLAAVLLTLGLAAPLAAADQTLYCRLSDGSAWLPTRSDRRLGWRADTVDHRDVLIGLTRRDGSWPAHCWIRHPIKIGLWMPARISYDQSGDDAITATISGSFPPTGPERPGGIITGGTFEWHVHLQRDQEEAWSGSFSGHGRSDFDPAQIPDLTRAFDRASPRHPGDRETTFLGSLSGHVAEAELQGQARAHQRPAPRQTTGHRPPSAGDHPRLFFGPEDLPALRQRATTPIGKRFLEKLKELQSNADRDGFGFKTWDGQAEASMQSSWAAGLGLRYQLTGDRSLAELAGRYVWSAMYSSLPNLNQWRQSHRILGVAIAYDLCRDAWDADLRANVYHYLLHQALTFARRHDIHDPLNVGRRYGYGGQTENYVSSFSDIEGRKYLAAAGLAALAICGEEPALYRPAALHDVRHISAAQDFQALPGVPVVELEGGLMFDRWLLNGPFRQDDPDPLASLGGYATARPIPGTIVECDGIALDFRHYIPDRAWDRKRGPRIYPRNCGRFYSSSTGQGYWPGRQLLQKWKDASGSAYKHTPVALTWYTLWRNPDAQYIQCFPNRYWQSRDVRMWLNGQEVQDDEIVTVEPGWYPVMVHLPVTGGYSTQAPHLRWYSVEQYDEETAAADRCAVAFDQLGAGDESLPASLAHAIATELRWFIDHQIDRQGWNAGALTEHLSPFVHAYKRVFGVDLASDSGLEQATPLAVYGRDLYQRRGAAYAMAHSFPNMTDTDRRVARWYLEQYDLPFSRPVDYLIPFLTFPDTVEPLAPSETYDQVQYYPDRQVVAFNRTSTRGEPDDFAVVFDGTGSIGNHRGALSLALYGERRREGRSRWFFGGGDTHDQQREYDSIPVLQDHYNESPARLIHLERQADGSGCATMEIGPLHHGRIAGRKQRVVLDPQPLIGSAIRRSVLVDYSGASGCPVLLVLCDRYRGFSPDKGRFFQGYAAAKLNQTVLEPNENRCYITEKGGKRNAERRILLCQGFSDEPIVVKRFLRDRTNGTGMLRLEAGKIATDKERTKMAAEQRVIEDEGSDELDALAEDLDDLIGDPHRNAVDPADSSTDATRDGDEYLYTVILVTDREPPTISSQGSDTDRVITVGDSSFRFNGRHLERIE